MLKLMTRKTVATTTAIRKVMFKNLLSSDAPASSNVTKTLCKKSSRTHPTLRLEAAYKTYG